MSKMETITLHDGGGTVEVDTEGCDQFGFQAGDLVAPEGHDNPATVLGVAPVPEEIRCDCVASGQPLLWVRGGEGQVCFIPPNFVDQLVKVEVH